MSKPFIHAKSSARRFGGSPLDYQAIHDFFDSSKAWFPDNRHRAMFHHAEGIFLVERIFGDETGCIVNSEGKKVSVRDIGEQHCREDFGGFIPTAADYLSCMESEPWMSGVRGTFPPSARKLRAAKALMAEPTLEVEVKPDESQVCEAVHIKEDSD